MRKWVVANLKKGDMARIAELAGTSAGTVKCIMRQRPDGDSQLSLIVWVKAYRYLAMRKELQEA